MLRKRVNVLLRSYATRSSHHHRGRNACKQWQTQNVLRNDSRRIHHPYHRDALDYYLSLHQHLMGLFSASLGTTSDGTGSSCGRAGFNRSADSRLKPSFPYAYLRDGKIKNWHLIPFSTNATWISLLSMVKSHGDPSRRRCVDLGSTSTTVPSGTGLHSGGKSRLSWCHVGRPSQEKRQQGDSHKATPLRLQPLSGSLLSQV
jgi:hypothetical protein